MKEKNTIYDSIKEFSQKNLWIEIDIDNLPENEILAVNFKEGSYGFREKNIGHLHIDAYNVIVCEGGEVLENCTHYIDINTFDL